MSVEKPEGSAREQFVPTGRPATPPGTPAEIDEVITWGIREPVPLPDRATRPATGNPRAKHRLVVLGDSLSQGFKSFAIKDTDLSWPAMVARYGGLDGFRYPHFDGPEPCPGLPLNLEALVRALTVPQTLLNVSENLRLAGHLRKLADQVEDYWERGVGADLVTAAPAFVTELDRIHHNLAVWGHDIRDALSLTVDRAQQRIDDRRSGGDGFWWELSSTPMERITLLTLAGGRPRDAPVSLAKALSDDGGIETLVVALGANNILGTVIGFDVRWSDDADYGDVEAKRQYNAWTPQHFRAEYDQLLEQVQTINAQNVIVFTVPHVTIAPMVRGVGSKMAGDRYFARYTRPWISDEVFNPNRHDCLTGDQLRVLDCAVDLYNAHIEARVADLDGHRGQRWQLLDAAGMLDRLAYRRYLIDDEARPPWWQPYDLPDHYRSLSPRLDTRFFRSDRFGRIEGGLFSLDGVHPTTAGYALVAREVMNLMTHLGVPLARVEPDWDDVLRRDTLLHDPPENLATVMNVVEIMDRLADLLRVTAGRVGV